ncbi:hypothetical protein Lal_00004523, partial [Lupinus albus]
MPPPTERYMDLKHVTDCGTSSKLHHMRVVNMYITEKYIALYFTYNNGYNQIMLATKMVLSFCKDTL